MEQERTAFMLRLAPKTLNSSKVRANLAEKISLGEK